MSYAVFKKKNGAVPARKPKIIRRLMETSPLLAKEIKSDL